jgi:multisubunit Na+/H+ antiporter MnhG subunit
VLLLLAFLAVLIFFGLGFALHILWILAVIFLVLWVVGYAIGRGSRAGRRRFHRW